MYIGLDKAHFLSSTGGCKPFDMSADGYCRAEGSAVFVLKRLSDAIGENDRIHGIIKDVVVNQSGHARSITHPHSETQVNLYKDLLRRTRIPPSSISVVEAHGTGTRMYISKSSLAKKCLELSLKTYCGSKKLFLFSTVLLETIL